MSYENDAILPDDFVDTPTTTEEVATNGEDLLADDTTEYTNDVEDTEQVDSVPSQPTLKVKYNHEEKELSYDEAVTLAQKGMNYEKALEREREKAYQDARDAYIAEQNIEWNGQLITTEAEYKRALEEQALIEKYSERDIPDEVIQELLESRRERQERKEQEAQIQAKQAEEKQFADFVEVYPDVDATTIPQEVWDSVEKGTPLVYAYMKYENAQLRTKTNVVQKNEENKQKAPNLGVTAFGSGEPEKSVDPFLAGFDGL